MKKLIQVSAMVGVIITLLAITAVQSYAGDLIYACISKSGQIRIVSATDSCRNNESSVQWENGELGLNSVYNNWVTSQGPGTRAEAYSRCMDGDILLSGGCYCVPEPTSDCLTVLEISKPVYNDIDQDGGA